MLSSGGLGQAIVDPPRKRTVPADAGPQHQKGSLAAAGASMASDANGTNIETPRTRRTSGLPGARMLAFAARGLVFIVRFPLLVRANESAGTAGGVTYVWLPSRRARSVAAVRQAAAGRTQDEAPPQAGASRPSAAQEAFGAVADT